jgi:hypothetical protein
LDAEEQYIAANLKEHLRDHALFNGFAPIENPKIAIALALLGQGLKKSPIGKKLDFANHLYLCKGLSLTKFLGRFKKNHIKICGRISS